MSKRNAAIEVIEILDDSSVEAVEETPIAVSKRLKRSITANNKTSQDDDDDDGGGKIGPAGPMKIGGTIITPPTEQKDEENYSDEVEWIPRVERPMMEAAATVTDRSSSISDDLEVEVIGCQNALKLPHMRQHCTEFAFVQDVLHCKRRGSNGSISLQAQATRGLEQNPKHCDMCYCFVCDVPVAECTKWTSPGMNSASESHCLASDKGIDAYKWKRLRNSKKGAQEPQGSYSDDSDSYDSDSGFRHSLFSSLMNSLLQVPSARPRNIANENGPFPPDHPTIARNQSFTKCRKCSWYVKLPSNRNRLSSKDWCPQCGRIANETDFNKKQSKPYKPNVRDVFLGTKVIPFRICSHDPREMSKYKNNWLQNQDKPGWEPFSEADNEEDVFRHRFGTHPNMTVVVESIPVLRQDKIYNDWSQNVDRTESDYIVLESRNHGAFLNELALFSSSFSAWEKPPAFVANTAKIAGDITAKWNKSERKGEFSVRIFLLDGAFSGVGKADGFSKLLGGWFDIFPFSLSTLTGGIDATEEVHKFSYGNTVSVPPFHVSETRCNHLMEEMANDIEQSVSKHNEAAAAFRSSLSITPSTSIPIFGGGHCNDTSLSGILKRFFVSVLPENINQIAGRNLGLSWVGRALGIESYHRPMRKLTDEIGIYVQRSTSGFRSYIRYEDHALACHHFDRAASETFTGARSLNGLMQQLESLGHPKAPQVQGLTVELLDFQRQAVGWALEKERSPGGVQSFLWAKLPEVRDGIHKHIYYNPILGRFSKTKPQLVRGGIIGSAMGMGKTLISLALILQNPAPAVPASGSQANLIDKSKRDIPGEWDPDLDPRSSESSSGTLKKGLILSRGTLVVCHVSLVGQWIDEAKSKLNDPGLIYSYHGQSRKRDAVTLAKHSVVVTTYATLRSDKFLHSKKGGDGYCPPCEAVRWWRIILDESHSIRDATTQQSKAVLSLVGDHKWCVSGTPMNTSIKDLKSQMNFIGLENVESMFNVFQRTVEHTTPGKSRRHYGSVRSDYTLAPFLFLMRTIMIRHSLKQKYAGTPTELMSLPPKEERILTVTFSGDERKEYQRIEKQARDFYESFKLSEGRNLSKHYLKVLQKLTPLRIACAGGRIPEMADGTVEAEDKSEDEAPSDMDLDPPTETKRKQKKVVVSMVCFKSKSSCLLKELIRIRDEEPNAKSLIFSQFTSTLTWLQEELPKRGFDFRTLSGGMAMNKRAQALHDFQHKPSTTIFLLSMRSAACGINLTQASRVFLLEPAMNPALEEQAIGRVYRLGQKSRIEIIRVIVKDSVETRLRKMLEKKYGAARQSDDASPPAASVVGNIHSDKTTVMKEEFDLLFGSEDPPEEKKSSGEG